MTNPFQEINEKLESIQRHLNDPAAVRRTVWLDINEASEYLKLSKSAIYKRTMTRSIPFHKFGKKLLFKMDELDNWIMIHEERSDLQGVKVEK